MTVVYLVRHGLTASTGRTLYGRTPGIDLDHRGVAQADQLVERFAGVRLTAIYSSPLERCVQTVAPLAADRRLDVRLEEGVQEMDAGSWTGRSLAQLRRLRVWPTVLQTPSAFTFPGGGEAFPDAQARTVAAIDRIARRHRKGSVLIGTHGDISRIAIAHYLGAPLDDFQRIVIDPVGVSVLACGGPRAHVVLVNDTGGLARFRSSQTPPWEAGGRPAPKMRG